MMWAYHIFLFYNTLPLYAPRLSELLEYELCSLLYVEDTLYFALA